jgi:hypothetical protein
MLGVATGDEMKNQDENSRQGKKKKKKEGTKLVLSPK